jgi:hypothetical protein
LLSASSRSPQSGVASSPFLYQQLETRQLLVAGIDFEPATGRILVEGSNDADVVTVVMSDANTVTVNLNNGFEVESFDVSKVTMIRFRGLDGGDSFTNDTNIDSTAFGHKGNDRFIGGSGNSRFQGGDGSDSLVGGSRNDVLRGGGDGDRLFGGPRHDMLFGGDGDDEIRGEHGRDRIFGEVGNDLLIGGNDDDRIEGGDGHDNINGNEGDDDLKGDGGNDNIKGGNDNDLIMGGLGDDMLQGHAGDDVLHGQSGIDNLSGGDDNDVLFGGLGFQDTHNGGKGSDRILLDRADDNVDGEPNDAAFEFVDQGGLLNGGLWIDQHVLIVDQAFARIAEESGGSLGLLKNPGNDNPIRVLKDNSFDPENAVAGGSHSLLLRNWDISDETENEHTVLTTIGLIAMNWDTVEEINSRFPSLGFHIDLFRQISEWGQGTVVPSGFVASTDGQWFYRAGTEFVDDRGRANPFADWATVWELFMNPNASPADLARLQAKLARIELFFNSIG